MPSLPPPRRARQRGNLTAELLIGVGLLIFAVFPLSTSFGREQKLARAYYYRAVALEIVDGEMEALRAGEWRLHPVGEHAYAVRAQAAASLPPGRFVLTRGEAAVRLEWIPDGKDRGGRVVREARVP
jgi:hypothetical protein